MTMSQKAKDGACKAIEGKTIESMKLSPMSKESHGYWIITFTDGSEICFDRMMAELGPNKAGDALRNMWAWKSWLAGYMKMFNNAVDSGKEKLMRITFDDLNGDRQKQIIKEFEEWWSPS